MILIAICGAKNSGKESLAMKLSRNSDCIWIKPYTDKEYPVNIEDWEQDDMIHLNEKQLDNKMNHEIPLAVTEIKGYRYVFFENQLRADFVVLIADDNVVSYLKREWNGDLITIKCHSKEESYSERNLLPDSEFDLIYHKETTDYEDFESQIVYR